MSELMIYWLIPLTTLLLGLGLGYTFLEFYKAERKLKKEDARTRRAARLETTTTRRRAR